MGLSKKIGDKSYSQDAKGDWYEVESPVLAQTLKAKVVNGVQYHQDDNGDWYEGEPVKKKDSEISYDTSNPYLLSNNIYKFPKQGEPIPLPKQEGFKDLGLGELTSRKDKNKIINPLTPIAKESTTAGVPNLQLQEEQRIQAEEAPQRAAIKKERTDKAIDETAKKVLESKGVTIPQDKALDLSQFSAFNKEKEKIQQAIDNGDVNLVFDKKANDYVLKRNTGFFETFGDSWNEVLKGNEEAQKFMTEMSDEERLEYIHKQEEEGGEDFPYAGKTPSKYAGSIGKFAGENAPFLGKAAGAAAAGTAIVAAAPETFGASLTGLPVALSFLATAPEMINHGAKDAIIEGYHQLKKQHPDWTDEQLIKEADQRKWAGGTKGLVENALLMKNGGHILSTPINEVGKKTIGNTIRSTVNSATKMGVISGGLSAAKDIEGKAEGFDTPNTEIFDKAIQATKDGATIGSMLHLTMLGLHKVASIPPLVYNAAKKAIVETAPIEEVRNALEVNEQAGKIPEGTTEKVVQDLTEYKEQLDKVNPELSEDAKSAVAGLEQKKANLEKEFAETNEPAISEQIETVNKQIEQINETGKIEGIETDPLTGEKFEGEPEQISQPIELSLTPKEETPTSVVKKRNKIIQDHLLDSDGDIDGAFKKAGFINVDGIWVAPEAVEYVKKISPEAWKHLKDNGIKYFEGGDDGRGLQKTISYDNTNIRGIGVNENVGEHHSGHDHTALHELAHHVWQEEMTPEQRAVFEDDSPMSDYAKSVKAGKEKTMGKHSEEDFAELYAKNKGDLNKAIAEKKSQQKAEPSTVSGEGVDEILEGLSNNSKSRQDAPEKREVLIKNGYSEIDLTPLSYDERAKVMQGILDNNEQPIIYRKDGTSISNNRTNFALGVDDLPYTVLYKSEKSESTQQPSKPIEGEQALKDVESTEQALSKAIPKDDQLAIAVTSLPTDGTVNYKDIKSGFEKEGETWFGRYLNNPSALNEKAKKIYDELVSGGQLRNDKILLGKNNRVMDGTHRLMARLAMGQTDFKYSKPSETFFTQPNTKTISEAYHKAKADGTNPELVKAVEDAISPKQNTKKNTVEGEQEQKTSDINEPTMGEGGGGDKGGEGLAAVGGDMEGEGGITHAANEGRRKETGLPEYEKEAQSFEQWSNEADALLAKGYDMEGLLKKMEKGEPTTPVENAIRKKYIASLDKQIAENPTPELLAAKTRYTRIQDKPNTEAGRQLVSLKGTEGAEDNLANFLMEEANANKVETLPQEKIDELKKKYEADKEVVKQLNERIAKLEEEAANRKIAEEVAKQKRTQSKEKKTSDDFVKERKEIVTSIKDKLRKARGELNAAPIPYAKELIAISPDVLRLMKSYIEEGVTKLADIVSKAHAEMKEFIPEITERDIRDIIKGDYTERKATRNEIAVQMRDLKSQQALLDKLESLQKGEPSKDPIKRQKRTEEVQKVLDEIKKFTDKQKEDAAEVAKAEKEHADKVKEAAKEEERLTKEFEKETNAAKKKALDAKAKEAKRISDELNKKTPEEIKLQSYKTGLKNKIAKLKKDLETGDFLKEPEPKKPLKLDKEAEKLLDEHIRYVKETSLRRAKAEFDSRGKAERWYDGVMQVLGLKRIVQTAIDLSIPFRQGVTLAFNPRRWNTFGRSFGAMLQSVFNSKKFDRIMYDIHQSPDYQNMLKDKMTFNEMDAVDSNSRNEDFQKSFIYKIPVLKEPLLASNRAADGFLNVARMDIYMNGKRMLEKQGITRENSPEAYEALGKWAMNMTGRGNMLKAIEDSHAGRMIASNTFFGARLMASRFNLLNPLYYANMPKAVRVEALKDMASFTGMIIATGLAAQAAGATISFDIDDADFLKIKHGNTKYDISGGLVQYIRTYLRLNRAVANRFRPSMTKKEKDDYAKFAGESTMDFFGYKLAPNTSYGLSAFRGKDPIGREFDAADAAKIYPMYVDDMIDAYKQSGPVSLATIGLPSILGVGVQTYADKPELFDEKEQKSDTFKTLKSKGISLPKAGTPKTHKIDVDETHPNQEERDGEEPYGLMTDEEFTQFNKYRKEYIETELPKMLNQRFEVTVEKPSGATVSTKKVSGKDLDKKELEQKVQNISTEASKEAKKKMGFEKEKNKTTVEEL